ncbi:hypothetical protein Rhsp01_44160 [Rhizobium sp. NBRC 114257]|uniref:Secreted protein n=1 Tax=Rhizobium dioscoreae TaxID=2653122 RepID=A0ABQ0Z9Q2_9HYPH|nr:MULTISPECIES: hypothetical protein [Rhizobium]GES52041.1 hypothetical protein RsS93_46550 [Rhizobium dioscoreae]GLU83240.1 hypothetical protein Rhsp01_44160 [Rhizobium sp. NBRC 114257]
MLSKIAATALISLCLATASLAQSSNSNGAASDQLSPHPETNQDKSVQGDNKAGRNGAQDSSKKTKTDSSKNSGGCNNQANAMTSTSANQEQAGSQSCD